MNVPERQRRIEEAAKKAKEDVASVERQTGAMMGVGTVAIACGVVGFNTVSLLAILIGAVLGWLIIFWMQQAAQ